MYKIISSTDNCFDKVIHIDLYLLYMCNLKCPYCFARYEHSHEWNNFLPKDKLQILIEKIKNIKGILHINLLGGEPSIYPFLKFALIKLSALKNVQLIKIYTNGLKDIKQFKNDKVKLVYTTHRISTFKTNYKEILTKIEKDDLLTIMHENNAESLYLYSLFKEKCNTIELNFIRIQNTQNFIGIDSIDNDLEFLIPHINFNKKIINHKQYINVSTKNLLCDTNYFVIKMNGDIDMVCFENVGNIYKKYVFSRHLIPCEHNHCVDCCFLAQSKYECKDNFVKK